MNKLLLLIVVTFLSSLVSCANIKGAIRANSILSDVRLLRPSTRAVLDGGKYTALIRADGQFEFNDIAPGSYLLEIQSADFIFPKVRVDIQADDAKVRGAYTQYGSLWDSRGFSLDYPFELRAKATANYFTTPQKFNLLGMFKNPMFLMIGFSAVMMLVLPKMMANMDPEMMKEMNQAQTGMPSLTQILSNPQAAAQQLQQMQQQQQ
ncbi:hypothetical protein VTP01DRAFT_4338 [Rhizomucor pusillus]|uniref:uncharacterized protein n=1 Tax=Rhizomucor pusillus TaxID=4840 RepID=UPI0037435552